MHEMLAEPLTSSSPSGLEASLHKDQHNVKMHTVWWGGGRRQRERVHGCVHEYMCAHVCICVCVCVCVCACVQCKRPIE